MSKAVGGSLVLLAVGLMACGAPKGAMPAFVAQHVGLPEARGITIGIDDAGLATRWAVTMEKRGMPEWIFHSADRHLGPGEDLEYQIAAYADGDRTYEITRRKQSGRVAVLAVREDYTVRHVERELATEEIPAMILTRLAVEQAFAPTSIEVRDIANGDIMYAEVYFVSGREKGQDVELLLSPDGMLVGRSRKIETQLSLVSAR